MVAENYLYKPSLRAVRQWLPAVGRIRRIRLSKVTSQKVSGWRARYGALLEGGIHFAALLGALIEETPAAVRASFPDTADPERRAEVEVAYPSGAHGEIRYAWNARAPRRHPAALPDRGREGPDRLREQRAVSRPAGRRRVPLPVRIPLRPDGTSGHDAGLSRRGAESRTPSPLGFRAGAARPRSGLHSLRNPVKRGFRSVRRYAKFCSASESSPPYLRRPALPGAVARRPTHPHAAARRGVFPGTPRGMRSSRPPVRQRPR